MRKNISLPANLWRISCALFCTAFISTCGNEKLPEPLTLTDLKGTKGDILQVVLDHHMDNYFHTIEKESGIQGKLSYVDAKTRTNTIKLDRIVRFEHPKLCDEDYCPIILLWQKESHSSEIDRWDLVMMVNGSSFAVGKHAHHNKIDLFITNKVGRPHYYWDNSTTLPQYDMNYNFRVKTP